MLFLRSVRVYGSEILFKNVLIVDIFYSYYTFCRPITYFVLKNYFLIFSLWKYWPPSESGMYFLFFYIIKIEIEIYL